MPKMTGSRFVAETLKGYGVTHMFFVPMGLIGAMAEMEDMGIRRVVTHGEKSAAYMADGYARATHKPGFCMSPASPGATNLAAGLGDPFMGCSPVIAITSARAPLQRYKHAYQEIEQAPPFDVVTKYNVQVDRVERLPDTFRQAFREATSGTPGPVHLDVQAEAVASEAELDVIIEEQFIRFPALRPEPDPTAVRQAAKVLMEARKPVIVAGGGVTASEAQSEVVKLAEMLTIPVATSLNGKGTIADNHPLSVGVCGTYSRWCANQIVGEADLVLFIGSHTGSQVTNNWRTPPLGTPVIQIDINPSELGRNYPIKVAVQGDAKVSLQKLIDALEPMSPNVERLAEVQRLVGQWREELQPRFNSNDVPIRPERICKEISDFLPDNALVVSDTGHSGIWSGTMIERKSNGLNYIRAAGSLGWAFPAAIGAKLAVPERPVLCFTGDGGFWYHIGELETALRHGANTVTVVNDNHALNQEQRMISGLYGGKPYGNWEELWVFQDTNLAAVAQAIGAHGERVTDPGQLKGALERAFAANKPAVIDVVTDISIMAPSPAGSDTRAVIRA